MNLSNTKKDQDPLATQLRKNQLKIMFIFADYLGVLIHTTGVFNGTFAKCAPPSLIEQEVKGSSVVAILYRYLTVLNVRKFFE